MSKDTFEVTHYEGNQVQLFIVTDLGGRPYNVPCPTNENGYAVFGKNSNGIFFGAVKKENLFQKKSFI